MSVKYPQKNSKDSLKKKNEKKEEEKKRTCVRVQRKIPSRKSRRLPDENETPVLDAGKVHVAGRQDHEVHLGQRVRGVQVALQRVQDALADVQGGGDAVAVARPRPEANRQLPAGFRHPDGPLDGLELGDGPSHQVGRHGRRRFEPTPRPFGQLGPGHFFVSIQRIL